MKVLVCGGNKTGNITTALGAALNSSGIEFLDVKNIEDIDDIFSKGEYFDRAIIMEQGWTHDGAYADEGTLRDVVNEFASNMGRVTTRKMDFIFIAQEDKMASIVHEEIMDIMASSIILVKKPKYFVNFFTMLVQSDMDKLPQELIYSPDMLNSIDENPLDNPTNLHLNAPKNKEEEAPTDDWGDTWDSGWDDFSVGNKQNNDNDKYSEVEEESSDDWEDTGNSFDSIVRNIDDGDNSDDEAFEDDGDTDDLNDGSFDDADEFESDFGNEDNSWGGFDSTEFDSESFEWDDQENDKSNDKYNELSSEIPDDFSNNYNRYDEEDSSRQSGNLGNLGDLDNGGFEYTQEKVNDDSRISGELGDLGDLDNGGFEYTQEDNSRQSGQLGSLDDGMFDESMYNDDPEDEPEEAEIDIPNQPVDIPETNKPNKGKGKAIGNNRGNNVNNNQQTNNIGNVGGNSFEALKATLSTFASRGTSILVTGCGGSGTSTVAFNMANTISKLGYTVLLVDMDTVNKAQSYISKDSYDSIYLEDSSVMAAVNGAAGASAYTSIIKPGLHLLTMGMASDSKKPTEAFKRDKINRFIQSAKNSHNFVIYDIPFEYATDYLDDITYAADNIVITIDASNWGIAKALINICNIGSDNMEETLFSRAQLLFNKYRGSNIILGKKIKTIKDIPSVMDKKVRELVGEDPGYLFETMRICGAMKDDPQFDNCWFARKQYSDVQAGFDMFAKLITNIVLHR